MLCGLKLMHEFNTGYRIWYTVDFEKPRRALTCSRVDGEEVLWIPADNLVAEPVLASGGRRVRVLGLDLDHGDVTGGVFADGWSIERLRRQRSIVVDVFHLNVDLNRSELRDDAVVTGVNCQPIGVFSLTVQHVGGVDNSWEQTEEETISLTNNYRDYKEFCPVPYHSICRFNQEHRTFPNVPCQKKLQTDSPLYQEIKNVNMQ